MHGRSLIAAPMFVEEAFTVSWNRHCCSEAHRKTPKRSAGVNLRPPVTARVGRSASLAPAPAPTLRDGGLAADPTGIAGSLTDRTGQKINHRCVWLGRLRVPGIHEEPRVRFRTETCNPADFACDWLPTSASTKSGSTRLIRRNESDRNWYPLTRRWFHTAEAVVAVDPAT